MSLLKRMVLVVGGSIEHPAKQMLKLVDKKNSQNNAIGKESNKCSLLPWIKTSLFVSLNTRK